jgi:hypothetical protein
MTGIALLYDEIAAKWPELLREIYPRATRLGVILDRSVSNQKQRKPSK